MKLRYILGAFLSALLFVGCSDDNEVGQLGSIQLDQTYVSIPETGGDVTVTINASSDWKFDDIYSVEVTKDDVKQKYTFPVPTTYDKTNEEFVQWLKPSVVSGPKGETKVTFHADATNGGREAELRITMGNDHQFLVVRQGSMEASTATCAEVLAAPDGKTFRVKGSCTAIANTTYGNWYLNDGTGEVYIYGTLDKDGKTKNFSSLGIEVGDIIEVEGPKTTYNGTVELVDVTVISITKSLIKLISNPVTVQKEGDEVEVKVAYKGNGAYVQIPEDAQSWINYVGTEYVAGKATVLEPNPADTAVFKFNVVANNGDTRKADLKFQSFKGNNKSVVDYTITQKGVANPPVGEGTAASPYNVTAALNYTTGLGADKESDDDVYVKGIISSIKYTYSAKYGTATYNISADGKENDVFTVYGSYFFDNQPWQDGNTQIAVGDEVVVCGKVVYYGGTTPEFVNKKNWLVSLNGKTSDGGASGPTSLDVDFKANGQGDWAIKDLVELAEGISHVWAYDAKYGMKASAYVGGARYETDSWLISPALNLANGATLTFSQAQRYGSGSDLHVMASTTYKGGAVNVSEWTEISIDQWPDGSNWQYITSTGKVPAGSNVTIAFRYTSTTSTAATWEIESLSVK